MLGTNALQVLLLEGKDFHGMLKCTEGIEMNFLEGRDLRESVHALISRGSEIT